MWSVTLWMLVTVAGSISLSYALPKLTGTFFCTHPTTLSVPRSTTAVSPHEVTALKAYSEHDKETTNLVESSFRREHFAGLFQG